MFRQTTLLTALIIVIGPGLAGAGIMPLGTSGWEASWDSSLDPYVSIHVDAETANAVFIQKTAEFIQPPGPGGFPTIPIAFRQVGLSTITQIVINDEALTNSTGVDWTDFHWDLLDGPDAWFEHPEGWHFDTSPLNNQYFLPNDRSFWVDGFGLGPGGTDNVVPNGTTWWPGNGAFNGELVIGVVSKPASPYTVFTLKETPTPEPATLCLLALGLAALRRKW